MLPTVANWALCFVLSSLLCWPSMAFADSAGAEATVVAHLYKDFGWQAFASQQELFGEGLAQQRREVLGRYFSAQLVDLLAKDAACQAKERGICRLDFDILFDSQDPVVTDLDVQVSGPGKVRVRFKNPVNGEIKTIDFRVALAAGQWRIVDILYGPSPARSLTHVLLGR